MKNTLTISLLSGMFFLLSATPIYAATPHNLAKTKSSREMVEREINRNILCPQFLAETTGNYVVRAIIEVDEAGKISVSDINAPSEKLKQYVVEQLKDVKVKNISNPEKFVLLVRFVVN